MLVITGPNMGGKSTYMRQNALIVLLAHIGSFVPASRATIGPIDRILTRIGAGDDLARGQSTFMVEMSETSYILHHATAQSLVLMDEIGRGTSTYDGLALAEACARHLAHAQPRLHAVRHALLRADHAGRARQRHRQRAPRCGRARRPARVHARGEGRPGRSQLRPAGRRAGRPAASRWCSRRADDWPNSSSKAAMHRRRRWRRPHWMHRSSSACSRPRSAALDALASIDPDELTPKQALEALYRLKALA